MTPAGTPRAQLSVAIAGSHGLIGSALAATLQADGHSVVRLVRRPAAGPGEIQWNPAAGSVGDGLADVDAVVNLAGANVGGKRWTKAYKAEIRDSRVLGTRTLAKAMASLDSGPKVLVNGSAIGYYGDRGPQPVDETARAGNGFLADVVVQWEAATSPARDAGARVVLARTGLVVSARGGAFGRLLPIFRYGLGGRVGSGQQYWSFISLHDEVSALVECLTDDRLEGPVNLVAPHAVTNRDVTRALADVVHRPAFLPVPAIALKAALGEFAEDIIASQNVVPSALTAVDFTWSQPTIEAALATLKDLEA